MSGAISLFGKGGLRLPSVPEEISAFLGKETSFEGKMTFQGMFRLEGRFEGEIFESGTLIVGESAVIKGKIGVHTLIINGYVEGEVYAKGRVEIHSAGKLYGNLITASLVISEGGIFEGYCKMEKTHSQEEDRPLISHREDASLNP
ncbi:MAG TPA: polymer-forming cytoskeletal protein [Thermodesulfobacteriota bacterium]|nr:polymer-forming cytoskeletal protein [Thermodesulfobacteriota bacterium]